MATDLDSIVQRKRRAKKPRPGAAEPSAQATSSGYGPPIRLVAGELHRTVAASAGALAATGMAYRRGGQLVRVGRLASEVRLDGVHRSAGSLSILAFDADGLRVAMSESALFEKFNKREDGWVRADPPADLARALISSPDRWGSVDPLLGIVEGPTLRPDGSVVSAEGYDQLSGLLLDGDGVTFPSIPPSPTRDQALAALAVLVSIIAEFPFISPADRSVMLSALLTAVVRRSLRSAPLFLFSAPKPGSGKSLLASTVSYVATGRPPAMMSQADDDESERKRVFSVLIGGAAVATIDNIERPLYSDVLCSVLTEPIYQDRVLGASKFLVVPTNVLWLATGSNVTIGGDLTSRTLRCMIDPGVERPEEREFGTNLHQVVPSRRGELTAAALTVIRAYIAAGSPRKAGLPSFGRFEGWQAWCRFPLVWLGEADPCDTRKAIEAHDPVREKLVPLLAAWLAVYGSEAVTCATAVADTGARVTDETEDARRKMLADLRAAISAAALLRGAIDNRRLGNFIAKHKGRIENGMKFQEDETLQGAIRWCVVGPAKPGSSESCGSYMSSLHTPTGVSQNAKHIELPETNSPNLPNPPSYHDRSAIDLDDEAEREAWDEQGRERP